MGGDKIVTVKLGAKNYPKNLSQLKDAPKIIYCRGNLQLLNSDCFAVVGTRNLTDYGREAAGFITSLLAQKGFTIVSGLALGIDAIAHQATLDAGGKTIAVLGAGVDDKNIAPRTNLSLARNILRNGGLLVSEYQKEPPSFRISFPQRDRIISGLSVGVLVVEAPEKSGALITAQCALEQNRDVFAIPGNIFAPRSAGTNRLLQKGAKLVLSAEDILEEYRQLSLFRHSAKVKGQNATEDKIIGILSNGPASLDDIINKSEQEAQVITATLTVLEINGKIKDMGSGRYKLNV